MTAPTIPPSIADLRAYLQGTLTLEKFSIIDQWVADPANSDEVENLLATAEPQPRTIPGLSMTAHDDSTFLVNAPSWRMAQGLPLGTGGMGIVFSVFDRVLQRTIALKSLRNRQPNESLECYILRESAFRREAVMLANLEHPAIVPLYEIGTLSGQSAFTMKKVDGQTLEELVLQGNTPRVELITIIQRVAEAVAYAHHRDIIHRDLTPANIIVGDFGAVYVLDWGLAEYKGHVSGLQVGTGTFMAPEQRQNVTVDPRMDVFSLGGLLYFVLTQQAPRGSDSVESEINVTLLDQKSIPRGLAAVAKRCLATDAANRYDNGQAVAEELNRWLIDGMTLAQAVGPCGRWWLRLRRSPEALGILGVITLAMLICCFTWWWLASTQSAQTQARLEKLAATVALDKPDVVALALDEVRTIRQAYPSLANAIELESRLSTASEVLYQQAEQDRIRARIQKLLVRTRQFGPWAIHPDAWRTALRDVGLYLDEQHISHDAAVLMNSRDQDILAESLAFLWRSESWRNKNDAKIVANLINRAGHTPGWQALGGILATAHFQAHDPILDVSQTERVLLSEPEPAAVALALFAPDMQLENYAQQRLLEDPGDFWALIAAGRAGIKMNDIHNAQHHAFVASGVEPGSILPHIILAYVSLLQKEWKELLEHVDRGLVIEANNVELLTLRVLALTKLDRLSEAQKVLANIPASHLQYHIHHRVGHPMELAVDALIAAGITIPAAPPELGPLTPIHVLPPTEHK